MPQTVASAIVARKRQTVFLKYSVRAIYRKLGEKGFLWASKQALDLLYLPLQKAAAIRAAPRAALVARSAKHAVFVCDHVHVRAIKIAYALRQAGWKVMLLHKRSLLFDPSECFDETRQFRNHWHALLIASEYPPVVYHVFTNWEFKLASVFIRYKPGKIVVDTMDVLTGMVKEDVLKRFPGQKELERYCYLNADGLCCRDLRTQYLKRKLGYDLPPRILFPEYCWPQGKVRRIDKLTDGTHVVYVGNVELDPLSPVAYQYELAALLGANKVHFHIYPSIGQVVPELRETMKAFVSSDVLSKYVHLHDPISPLDIAREISRYHYGLIISTKNIDYGDDHDTYFDHQSDYFFAAKIFDYLDAGLHTLTQNARFARFILGRCNGGSVVTSLEDIARRCKDEPAPGTILPKSLLLETNTNRLINFYSKLTHTEKQPSHAT
jgi:hypothetical protein